MYLFGVTDEDYYGAIDLRTGRSLLFMPRLPDSYAVWMGHIATPEEVRAGTALSRALRAPAEPAGCRRQRLHLKERCCPAPPSVQATLARRLPPGPPSPPPPPIHPPTDTLYSAMLQVQRRYAVDAVHYVDEMAGVLAALDPPCMHLLEGVNSDRWVRLVLRLRSSTPVKEQLSWRPCIQWPAALPPHLPRSSRPSSEAFAPVPAHQPIHQPCSHPAHPALTPPTYSPAHPRFALPRSGRAVAKTEFEGMEKFRLEREAVFRELTECRVVGLGGETGGGFGAVCCQIARAYTMTRQATGAA